MEIMKENVTDPLEIENEMNLLNITKVRKKVKILDSDSEDEEAQKVQINTREELPEEDAEKDNLEEQDNLKEPSSHMKFKRLAVIDSDSDDDSDSNVREDLAKGNDLRFSDVNNEEKQNVAPVNSDAEDVVDEEEVTPHNKSFPDEKTAAEAVIYTTNNKGELIEENDLNSIKKSSLLALCDSEPEEDTESSVRDTIDGKPLEPKLYKRKQKKNEEKTQRMTAQEAAKQRTEIRAESQRMLRESNISLPYHKPKSYTIKEFLQKRSKLASALPPIPKAPPSIAIKLSKEQLKEVSKKLDERIKEVEEFYKSESEEDEEERKDDASDEIRSWLDVLVDNAMDTVENEKIAVEETEEEQIDESEIVPEESSNQHESMEYEFNLEDVDANEDSKRTKISDLIKDKLDIQPKLSGTPDDIIDLEEGVTKSSGVKKLVEKFFQNAAKKVPHKHKVELDVIGVGSGGEIIKETVSMNVDDEEEEPALVETPGAKLKKLREELEVQMAQKRLELWKQKHEQGDCLTVEKKPDYEESAAEKDLLDDDEEEEFEMTESEPDEMEEDEEEYDVEPKKPKVKSAFIEDEANEDEDADDEDYDDDEPANDADQDDNDGDIEETPEIEELKSPKKKVLRRILKPFSADSDEEEQEQSQADEGSKILKYYTTDEDDFMPPNLPRVGKTPQRTQIEKNKSEFDFLTPVTYLTGLQNLNSDSKFSKGSPSSPCIPISPPQENGSQSQVQKKLFPENAEQLQNTQGTIDDLAQLCSGTFPETQNCDSGEKISEAATEELPSTQELLNLCSGDFLTADSSVENKNSKKDSCPGQNEPREIKNLDEESDQIISQLLDEDELERFKKKFESPINPVVRKVQIPEDVEEVNASGFINSDDENEGLELKTKKRKKLVFSDDEDEPDEDEEEGEDEEEEGEDEEEGIDLHDEEQQLEDEIVAQESGNFKIGDFLENEAELSESEWGSADEDERGLDEFEEEQGDQEKIDENKVRTELERIHMRQLLDEDNREVKILQELLLEDGELHGTGRKRQFRWKALDSADNGEFEKRDDDDIFLDEEESEEHWRKMRHKREMFLKKKSETSDDVDSILSDSQILKVGQQIIKNKSFISQNSTPTNKSAEDDCKEPFSLLNKRGSFLSRNDQVLHRLAEYTKVTTTVGTSAKNSKSFVFQTVEATEITVKDNNNKRKATEGTPNVIKKLRLDDLSPAVGKKNAGKSSRAKKLFGNW